MGFFEQQERARRSSVWLVVLFALAVAGTLAAVDALALVLASWAGGHGLLALPDAAFARAHGRLLAWVSLGTGALIAGGSLWRTAQLRAGGEVVAEGLGGELVPRDTRDPAERRLLNVVDEVAIASGLPAPPVYVLRGEPGINAFAAGWTPADAVLGVTAGTLERLGRDELQGVVAHELGHVCNGDMRLNTRLLGALHGLALVALSGRVLLQGLGRRRHARDPRGLAVVGFTGMMLVAIGSIGVFFGRLVQAALSRSRELLADATAVQLTRQPRGLAAALWKIAQAEHGSRLDAAEAPAVSHMLFGAGTRLAAGWLATHPPLGERIRAIDPYFRPPDRDDLPDLQPDLAKGEGPPLPGAALARSARPAAAASVAEWVGQPGPHHLDHAVRLLGSVPAALRASAATADGAEALLLALVLARGGNTLERQRAAIERERGRAALDRVEEVLPRVHGGAPELRFPLLELALPALRAAGPARGRELLALVERLIASDARVELFEYALARVLCAYLSDAAQPWRARAFGRGSLEDAAEPARLLLHVLAAAGHAEPAQARAAAREGEAHLGLDPEAAAPPQPADWTHALDGALQALDALAPLEKRRLVEACAATVAHDGRLAQGEAELLRAVCAALHLPVPPLVAP